MPRLQQHPRQLGLPLHDRRDTGRSLLLLGRQRRRRVGLRFCACGGSFQLSVGLLKIHLYTLPGQSGQPVANFSGTPNSGNARLRWPLRTLPRTARPRGRGPLGTAEARTRKTRATRTARGSYTVALTATNASGSNTNTKTGYVTVTAPAPVADFSRNAAFGPHAADGDLHGRFHQQPDRVVVDLRGRQHQHGAQSDHTYNSNGVYTAGADGDQQLRQQHLHQGRLHHGGRRTGGELLRDAALGRSAADR